ncbi:hypothetical protein IQ254_30275 [Nodosilinea sp. LEGE 07088]|uniref:hypothetical protein n=1 Tax=Nodosilinea sp. LEGE 07088 TaxID=2777968 RepID=UPI00187F5F8F|nr:hypothetical protein [Nodosilinea sp. LEGE 07088]MBE9141430.1 hypothetical protein [Nodosilinea sp. LEGE 07088]
MLLGFCQQFGPCTGTTPRAATNGLSRSPLKRFMRRLLRASLAKEKIFVARLVKKEAQHITSLLETMFHMDLHVQVLFFRSRYSILATSKTNNRKMLGRGTGDFYLPWSNSLMSH